LNNTLSSATAHSVGQYDVVLNHWACWI